MFIWSFVGKNGSSRAVKIICRNKEIRKRGLYVAIFVGYEDVEESDTIGFIETRNAIDICKEYNVPIILMRLLFNPSGTELYILYDVEYLISRIYSLNQELDKYDLDFGGFEAEAYGKDTPLHDYMRGGEFTSSNNDRLVGACREATARAGRVWGVTPAGKAARKIDGTNIYRYHPYMKISQGLGHHQMCQGTYYNRPTEIARIDYDYDTVGMFINVVVENKEAYDKWYFLPSDVWTNQTALYQNRQGVWVWTWKNDLEVARMLVQHIDRVTYDV